MSLEHGTVLYHGSYTEVSKIDLDRCRPGKDFGRGFYLTKSYDQAKRFSVLSARKNEGRPLNVEGTLVGFVSAFEYDASRGIELHTFEEADREWLHFVAGNRRAGMFPEAVDAHARADIIAGKIANDQTARTLQLYVSGAYGTPGSEQADAFAITMLLPNRLENQFCFRSKRSIEALRFVGSEAYHG